MSEGSRGTGIVFGNCTDCGHGPTELFTKERKCQECATKGMSENRKKALLGALRGGSLPKEDK